MQSELIEFDPSNHSSTAPNLSLSPAESVLLAPDHPFLGYGQWRGFAAIRAGALAARAVASIDSRQQTRQRSVGCVGFMRVDEQGARTGHARAASEQVLAAATAWLHDRRVDVICCPVQFSTWYGHRAMTSDFPDSGGPPSFPLEPRNRQGLVDLVLSSDFVPAHRAVSYDVTSESVIDSAGPALDRLAAAGLRDRPLRISRLEEELQLLHQLSMDIFRDGWGFSELSLEEFCSMYRPLAQSADAELVRILESADGHALGFAFAMAADPSHAGAGRFIVKTLGVLAEARRRHPGVGAGLTALIHQAARDRGYVGGIHALMAHGSMAHRLSMKWGTQFRSYATFVRGSW